MTTRFRVLPFLLVLLGMTLPAAAQTPPGPPRFLLESVVVEGVQRDAVREIVAAESLLQLGREYTEQELREAVYRVKRLPFVMDAEFSLRKGAERGSYQLVITVEETRLVFFSLDAEGQYLADDESIAPGEDRVDWGAGATVGGRWFVGPQGLVFASVQGSDSIGPSFAQAGYTRYNLFGRGGFASVVLGTDISDEYGGDSYQGTLSVGVPIVGNHSLRADLDWYEVKDDSFGYTLDNNTQRLGLAWIYNTTDDPLFPTSGTRIDGGAVYGQSEQELRASDFSARSAFETLDLGLSGSRHWALTHRQAVFAALSGRWSSNITDLEDEEGEFWQTAVTFGHSTNLWGFARTERFGDFRWENTLQVSSFDSDSSFSTSESVSGSLVTALVFRNAWGVTRLSFSYLDVLHTEFRLRERQ